jgi:hypothetical protein
VGNRAHLYAMLTGHPGGGICDCRLCTRMTQVETPMHPRAFRQWAREVSRQREQARRQAIALVQAAEEQTVEYNLRVERTMMGAFNAIQEDKVALLKRLTG